MSVLENGNDFYFLIFEKSDRRLLFPLVVPDLVLSDGEAHEMVDIVSASAPSAVIHVSIDVLKIIVLF